MFRSPTVSFATGNLDRPDYYLGPVDVVEDELTPFLVRKRLLSLSAQKFISDLSRDAYHFAKLRLNGTAAGRGRPAAGVVSCTRSSFISSCEARDNAERIMKLTWFVVQDRSRVVLTMDDLSLALGEHGVNVKKPDYCELAACIWNNHSLVIGQ